MIHSYAAKNAKAKLEPFKYEPDKLGPWDIDVDISHCGLCHSDLHLLNNDWGISTYPLVPGHEIIGIVKARGTLVTEIKEGQRVGIGWQRSSCSCCEWCHHGLEQLCPEQQATCLSHYGGFAEKIRTDARFAFPIPDELDSVNAAPLLCGGATVFSPLIEHAVCGLTRIGVIGIGGLGHLALQFANAFGCEVFAFSSSASKESEAKAFGAHHFISSSDSRALKKMHNSIDLLLCCSSASMDFSAFLNVLRPRGKMCELGVPADQENKIHPSELVTKRLTLCGSNIASPSEIRQMLQFAARHQIEAKTELYKMSEINEVLKKLEANQICYRAVLKN